MLRAELYPYGNSQHQGVNVTCDCVSRLEGFSCCFKLPSSVLRRNESSLRWFFRRVLSSRRWQRTTWSVNISRSTTTRSDSSWQLVADRRRPSLINISFTCVCGSFWQTSESCFHGSHSTADITSWHEWRHKHVYLLMVGQSYWRYVVSVLTTIVSVEIIHTFTSKHMCMPGLLSTCQKVNSSHSQLVMSARGDNICRYISYNMINGYILQGVVLPLKQMIYSTWLIWLLVVVSPCKQLTLNSGCIL